MNAVVDNDILLKGACYGFLWKLCTDACGVLGAARFVVPDKIRKKGIRGNTAAAIERLNAFLSSAEILEPTADEQDMAADFELLAQRSALSFDAGESLLSAIVITRVVPLLRTGDKRAIRAMELLLDQDGRLASLQGRIHCLEQLVLAMVNAEHWRSIADAVCSEPAIDKTLGICFACSSGSVTYENIIEGLNSYIRDLRANSARVLRA